MVAKTAPAPHSLMLATATLSLAVAVTAMLFPVQAPFAGLTMLTVGFVVSPPPVPFETVTVTTAVAVRPAPSVTVRLSVWDPFADPVVFHAADALGLPVLPLNSTLELSTLSVNVTAPEAVPAVIPTVTLPLTVAPLAGLVIDAVKGGRPPPPPVDAPDGWTGDVASLLIVTVPDMVCWPA